MGRRVGFRYEFPGAPAGAITKANHMLGTIHRLKADRGFGFVRPDGDNGRGDHFMHASKLVDLIFDERLIGQRVAFDSEQREKGLVAVNVRPVS